MLDHRSRQRRRHRQAREESAACVRSAHREQLLIEVDRVVFALREQQRHRHGHRVRHDRNRDRVEDQRAPQLEARQLRHREAGRNVADGPDAELLGEAEQSGGAGAGDDGDQLDRYRDAGAFGETRLEDLIVDAQNGDRDGRYQDGRPVQVQSKDFLEDIVVGLAVERKRHREFALVLLKSSQIFSARFTHVDQFEVPRERCHFHSDQILHLRRYHVHTSPGREAGHQGLGQERGQDTQSQQVHHQLNGTDQKR